MAEEARGNECSHQEQGSARAGLSFGAILARIGTAPSVHCLIVGFANQNLPTKVSAFYADENLWARFCSANSAPRRFRKFSEGKGNETYAWKETGTGFCSDPRFDGLQFYDELPE